MGKKAVDVVLLPDESMTDRTIEANHLRLPQPEQKIVLNKHNCLPHISLAMGCVEHRDIETIGEILNQLARSYAPKRLRVVGVQCSTSFSGEPVSVFEIERTKQLQQLHETVMDKLEPYFSYDVTADMIAGGLADESTLGWIRNYPTESSYSNFSPHITIGYGRLDQSDFPIDFSVAALALCHLGNHCTCAAILPSAGLKD